jgi:hypothetical protein
MFIRLTAILVQHFQLANTTGYGCKWLRYSLSEGLAEHEADTHRN